MRKKCFIILIFFSFQAAYAENKQLLDDLSELRKQRTALVLSIPFEVYLAERLKEKGADDPEVRKYIILFGDAAKSILSGEADLNNPVYRNISYLTYMCSLYFSINDDSKTAESYLLRLLQKKDSLADDKYLLDKAKNNTDDEIYRNIIFLASLSSHNVDYDRIAIDVFDKNPAKALSFYLWYMSMSPSSSADFSDGAIVEKIKTLDKDAIEKLPDNIIKAITSSFLGTELFRYTEAINIFELNQQLLNSEINEFLKRFLTTDIIHAYISGSNHARAVDFSYTKRTHPAEPVVVIHKKIHRSKWPLSQVEDMEDIEKSKQYIFEILTKYGINPDEINDLFDFREKLILEWEDADKQYHADELDEKTWENMFLKVNALTAYIFMNKLDKRVQPAVDYSDIGDINSYREELIARVALARERLSKGLITRDDFNYERQKLRNLEKHINGY